MEIAPFSLEQYFARYEFEVPYNLCASDCESVTIGELLQLADISLSDFSTLQLGYTESQGHPELRAAIAALYEQVDSEAVVFLAAPEEGIYLTMRTLLEPGDGVIVLTPAYDSLFNVAAHICGEENVQAWPIVPGEEAGWALDLDALERLLTPQTRLLVVNFPHNPTGYLPDRERFETLVEMARRQDIWLFSDEMYRGLEYDEHDRLPSAADRYERAITLAGLSKVHGLPGLRAGWLVVHDDALRERLINWKHYTTICAAAPSELLALAGLAAQPQLVARNLNIINGNLLAADAFFARWPDHFRWRPPHAGTVALVGVNTSSATAYCERLVRRAGVLLLPGPYLGSDDQHVRLGFGRADFAYNLRQYENYLQEEMREQEL
ncbi:MAG: aminotransferase class I/II-fold pyridoxal phosphate-dependent enzyme [Candidatus Promineifilaceae bacterium]|nr:aminotransferase class I/II-fold pyridoxal phosphate-dependent enzyme [Candidatus Promineifilaceae bacterium]